MRIIPTILLVYLVLGVQSGLSPYVAVNGVAPNLLLGVIIFIALYAPREPALVGAFVAGLLQDMLTQAPMGVHPLAYAAVAIGVRGTQPAIQRSHWLTHILVAVIGAATHAATLYLVGLRVPPRYAPSTLVHFAAYSAIVAPFFLRVLIWCRNLFVSPVTAKTAGFAASKG